MHTSIYTFRCIYRYRQIYVCKYAFTVIYIYIYICIYTTQMYAQTYDVSKCADKFI